METMLDKGYRVSGAVVAMTALVANATAIFTISNAFAGTIGTKSFTPKKLRVYNAAAGAGWLRLGTGVGGAFAATMPAVWVLNNMDSVWQEFELPDVPHYATMTAYPDAIAGGGAISCQVEVEEQG
jgi:hypothetical protein